MARLVVRGRVNYDLRNDDPARGMMTLKSWVMASHTMIWLMGDESLTTHPPAPSSNDKSEFEDAGSPNPCAPGQKPILRSSTSTPIRSSDERKRANGRDRLIALEVSFLRNQKSCDSVGSWLSCGEYKWLRSGFVVWGGQILYFFLDCLGPA
jgi:hypothetical protein